MKLYSKTLTSLDALEREKIRLRYERRGTKAKHLLPDIGKAKKKLLGGKKSKSNSSEPNLLGMAMTLLNGGSPLQTALSLSGPVLSLLSNSKAGSAPKRLVNKLVKDVVISYVIGKGLQLAIRGVKAYNRSQKAKKAARAANLMRQA